MEDRITDRRRHANDAQLTDRFTARLQLMPPALRSDLRAQGRSCARFYRQRETLF
jgi:hypothetical protein